MKKILLHVCCGPCSTVPLRLFTEAAASFSALFDNPNIQPTEEYERRLATFRSFAEPLGVAITEGSYDPDGWDRAIGDLAGVYPLIEGDASWEDNHARRAVRCQACYAYRFERLAARAEEQGFTAIATTLSISPYQFTDIMAAELLAAAKRRGLTSTFVDYRAFFSESTRRSRELGMYRQNYCGCRWSKTEAEAERAARKVAHAHART
jgi:predicted adenine nucleotide alpha hydrolase (AANH) superfamily ATPase